MAWSFSWASWANVSFIWLPDTLFSIYHWKNLCPRRNVIAQDFGTLYDNIELLPGSSLLILSVSSIKASGGSRCTGSSPTDPPQPPWPLWPPLPRQAHNHPIPPPRPPSPLRAHDHPIPPPRPPWPPWPPRAHDHPIPPPRPPWPPRSHNHPIPRGPVSQPLFVNNSVER